MLQHWSRLAFIYNKRNNFVFIQTCRKSTPSDLRCNIWFDYNNLQDNKLE